MTTIRKGDIVTVRARVIDVATGGGVYVDIGHYSHGTRIDLDRVEVVEPHFNVGELVTIGGGATGTVIGAVDGHVWVRHTFGDTFGTYLARDLRLAVDPSDPVPVDTSLIETPPSAPYIASAGELAGLYMTDAEMRSVGGGPLPDLPHLADAPADV